MKIRTRIMLASGSYFVLGLILFSGLAFVHPAFMVFAVAWLFVSRRIIRQWLLPPLFRFVKCGNCKRKIPLRCRWKCSVDQWTDSKIRHALAVYSDRGHEVRSFNCQACKATIALQKGDRDIYKRWEPVDAYTPVASGERPKHGLQVGFDRMSMNGLFARWWRKLRKLPVDDPVILSHEVLGRHGTIFGATGTGKSTLIISLARQVFESGDGATFLDPAGDLSRDLIRQVPPERIDDVLYINVADQEFPFPFNILKASDANERNLLVDEVLGIFKTIYSREWGSTLAHVLRMALNSALEFGGSFADVYDLIANLNARQRLVRKIKTKELRDYWNDTFPSISSASRTSLRNKLEPIIRHPFLGPILCSRECAFEADEVIRDRKILIVNLATGTRADFTTEILGTFIVNKIVAAAYRQSSIADKEKRVRHYFFVDEFQNFMARSSGWDRSLSELRKFKLCLILATQFVEQVEDKIRAAIFGNVGFLVAFRVGHRDSKLLSDEFEGSSKQDLHDLQRGQCFVRVGTHAFNVRTVLPPDPVHDPAKQIIERMHKLISKLRKDDPTLHAFVTEMKEDSDHVDYHDNEEPMIEVKPDQVVLADFA